MSQHSLSPEFDKANPNIPVYASVYEVPQDPRFMQFGPGHTVSSTEQAPGIAQILPTILENTPYICKIINGNDTALASRIPVDTLLGSMKAAPEKIKDIILVCGTEIGTRNAQLLNSVEKFITSTPLHTTTSTKIEQMRSYVALVQNEIRLGTTQLTAITALLQGMNMESLTNNLTDPQKHEIDAALKILRKRITALQLTVSQTERAEELIQRLIQMDAALKDRQ